MPDVKDAVVRAVKTFIAVAIPAAAGIPALVAVGNFEAVPTVAGAAALAGAAAVITFVWNYLLDYSRT